MSIIINKKIVLSIKEKKSIIDQGYLMQLTRPSQE